MVGEITLGNKRSLVINPSDIVYERDASTLASPVAAGATDSVVLTWSNPYAGVKELYVYAVGNDQHDNSEYTWEFDSTEMTEITGSSRVGSITDPFRFPAPIKVKYSVRCLVTNNNLVAYPNNGVEPADSIPYEAVFFGIWDR